MDTFDSMKTLVMEVLRQSCPITQASSTMCSFPGLCVHFFWPEASCSVKQFTRKGQDEGRTESDLSQLFMAIVDPRFRHIVQVCYEAFRHFAHGITSVLTCSLRGRIEHRQNSRISRTAASSCTAGKWVYISYVIYGCIEICEAKHGDMKYSSHSPLRHREFAFTVGSSPLSQMEAPTKRG